SNIAVIDTATNAVTGNVSAGGTQLGIAINPAGTRAYAGLGNGSIAAIDTTTNAVIATVPLGGASPFTIAINPSGTRAYVTTQGPPSVSVIDTASNTVITTIALSSGANGVAVNPM